MLHEIASIDPVITLTPTGELPLTTAAAIKKRIVSDLENCRDSTGGHATLSFLQWQNTDFRDSLLDFVIEGLARHFINKSEYNFVSHWEEVQDFITLSVGSKVIELDEEPNVRLLKGFVTACASLAYKVLYPRQAETHFINMERFMDENSSKPEFIKMMTGDWEKALNYRNSLALSTALVTIKNNKLMHLECGGLMCGINKCFQGSNPGRVIKRCQVLLEEFAEIRAIRKNKPRKKTSCSKSPSSPPNTVEKDDSAFSITGNSIEDLIRQLERMKHLPCYSSDNMQLAVHVHRRTNKHPQSTIALEDSHVSPTKRSLKRPTPIVTPGTPQRKRCKKAVKPVPVREEEERDLANCDTDNFLASHAMRDMERDDLLSAITDDDTWTLDSVLGLDEDLVRDDHSECAGTLLEDEDETTAVEEYCEGNVTLKLALQVFL